jgi:hypothetical protein
MHRMLLLAALLAAGQPALAEYETTRWGMTPDEVVAAMGGDTERVRDKKDKRILDHQRLAASTIEQDGLRYEVSYFFGKDGKGLTMVSLIPVTTDINCAATRDAFTRRYGTPEELKRPQVVEGLDQNTLVWRTGPVEELVEYLEIVLFGKMRHCQILYQQTDGTRN